METGQKIALVVLILLFAGGITAFIFKDELFGKKTDTSTDTNTLDETTISEESTGLDTLDFTNMGTETEIGTGTNTGTGTGMGTGTGTPLLTFVRKTISEYCGNDTATKTLASMPLPDAQNCVRQLWLESGCTTKGSEWIKTVANGVPSTYWWFTNNKTVNDAYLDMKAIHDNPLNIAQNGKIFTDFCGTPDMNKHSAQIIRLEKNSGIHVKEIEVYSGGTNIALTGTATMSSQIQNQLPAPPSTWQSQSSWLNDGIKNNGTSGMLASTKFLPIENEWMQIKFTQEYPIEKIVIYNRDFGAVDVLNRIIGVDVILKDATEKIIYKKTITAADVTNNIITYIDPFGINAI
jgi:hypothetical protein